MPINGTSELSEVGIVDLVLLAVKIHQITDSIQVMGSLIGPKPKSSHSKNNVDSADGLVREFGADRALPGTS